jgi:hypothetical protein
VSEWLVCNIKWAVLMLCSLQGYLNHVGTVRMLGKSMSEW